MHKLTILSKALDDLNLKISSIKVAALKYNYPTNPDDPSGDEVEGPIEEELDILAKSLELTIPTFLGSSGRNNSAKETFEEHSKSIDLSLPNAPENFDGSYGSYVFLTSTADGTDSDGHPIALKLVRYGEIDPYKFLQNLKLPDPKLNKFLPIIYRVQTFKDAGISVPRLNRLYAGFVIMEQLHPLHGDIRAIFNSYGFQTPILSKLKEEDIAATIWAGISTNHILNIQTGQMLKENTKEILHKEILNFIYKNSSTKHYSDFANSLMELVVKVLKDNIRYEDERTSKENFERIAVKIATDIHFYIDGEFNRLSAMRQAPWPKIADSIAPFNQLNGAIFELLRIGIRPDDIKADNIMQRTSGELVISDPGHFVDIFGDLFENNY